ncbi:PRPP-binding protein, adenine/guanine phosphoribosyltransferase [Modestobacter italicus]|uniref:PRPP-binding protein, adenine/guanine phosphoribosyltransferase n=1 Tax=Modestobacter italicus (strain DSM 44449 / CECT 9708 / BC 501) TaxID=2732864 RepID=I4ERZ0_MODI5|nr:phosphoribosyltransferase family protein [Modestobacter marinus]CCH86153.1 PRPP-binding protein, adenine/guanine phosphoribosyltransferase [Modestobacter marinus]
MNSTADLRDRLKATFAWRGDRTDARSLADVTGWWRDPALLADLGPALGDLVPEAKPTVVLGPQSRGSMLGALVATALDIGLVEVRKDDEPLADSDAWLQRTTPPDYRDRHLSLGFRRGLVKGGDRVLFVDDWIQTGGQALATRALVEAAGATWCGAAVVVDGLSDTRVRRDLAISSLIHVREL